MKKMFLIGLISLGFASVVILTCVLTPSEFGTEGFVASSSSSSALQILQNDTKIYGGRIHFKEDLNLKEAIDLWHLSEGSDVYPLNWFINMKSQFSNLKEESYLNERLDEKFGVIAEPQDIFKQSPYPFPWIGLTAAWSGLHSQGSDVLLESGQSVTEVELMRQLKSGEKSIAMVGVNCAFCHSNTVSIEGQHQFIEGAPSMLNIRGFFQDIYASTAKVMLTEDLLADFLNRSQVRGDTRAIANEFTESLKKDLGLTGFRMRQKERLGSVVGLFNQQLSAELKTKTLRRHLFDNREVMADYLTRLLKLTYGMDEVSTELRLRMSFLAHSIGVDPELGVTPEGYARTDAFGRIANLVARTKDPIPLTATSSVPSMWNLGYRDLFHWNANTNSVVMRNLGQSFGLGAILTNPGGQGLEAFDSTVNLQNLIRLEKLIYKVAAPQWPQEYSEVDLKAAIQGCTTFHQKCASCHMPRRERVGPTQELVNYNLIPLKVVGTDEVYTHNQATPVEGVAFKTALFDFTSKVRDRYYQRYSVPEHVQRDWEHKALRGKELFRDTVLGESSYSGESSYLNVKSDPEPGYPARHLAGVWATAPYLHNGSVPSIEDLLKPAHLRPKMFFVGNREYNVEKMGFASNFESLPQIEDLNQRAQALLDETSSLKYRALQKIGRREAGPANIWEAKIWIACEEYPERCFDATNIGNSNAGHEGEKFGTHLSDEKKRELIEFLKILRPEPEYSHREFVEYYWDGAQCAI